MRAPLRISMICALIGGPAVLALELVRRAGTLADIFGWLDDAVGAALLVAAALWAARGGAAGALALALAWAFAAGQLTMSLIGQLGHSGPDPSGQPAWMVVAVKAALLGGAATLAFSTMRHSNRETRS